MHRYTMECVLMYEAYASSGIATSIGYMWVSVISGMTFALITQYTLVMRLYGSWDQGKSTKWVVAAVFVVGTALLIVFLFLYVLQVQGLVIYKILETPRRTNIEVLHQLQKDGFKAFITVFLVNTVGLIISINGNVDYLLPFQ
ncbi:hypothetical protein BDQ17DRAFT_1325789 [Cyathus striatus]|nr:hypothetical protein BDQ17DRAFT_1325789 [Cyathus striatus]